MQAKFKSKNKRVPNKWQQINHNSASPTDYRDPHTLNYS